VVIKDSKPKNRRCKHQEKKKDKEDKFKTKQIRYKRWEINMKNTTQASLLGIAVSL
jgi:hypothetical protein